MDLECYQRGARETLAPLEFRRKDSQPGKYACRSTDGKNADKSTLEVLGGRQYRCAGGSGKYQVDILGDQGDDYSDVEFFGGPLEDMNVSYKEDDKGEFRNTYVFSAVVGTGGGIYYYYLTFKKDGSFSRQVNGGFSLGATTDGTAFGDTTTVVGGSTSRSSVSSVHTDSPPSSAI